MDINPFESLLGGEEDVMTPEKRAALAAALRRDYDYGTVMQMMGLPPTVKAGEGLQHQSLGNLKLSVEKQLNTDENKRRAQERQQSQDNWKRSYDADEAYRKAQLNIDQQRLDKPDSPNATKHKWELNPNTGEYFDAYGDVAPEGGGMPPPATLGGV